MKLNTLAVLLLTATTSFAAPVGPPRHGEAAKLAHPPPCGRKSGEMWIPSHPNLDGSCPTADANADGTANDSALGKKYFGLPPPCGRFIGEMWTPMKRRSDGTCPPGSQIEGLTKEGETAGASAVLGRGESNGDEWKDPMPGHVILDGPGGGTLAEYENEDDVEHEMVEGTLDKGKAVA